LKYYFNPFLQPFETPPFSLLSPKVSARKEEANQKEKKRRRRKEAHPDPADNHAFLAQPSLLPKPSHVAFFFVQPLIRSST
jgi:hypothetical protein